MISFKRMTISAGGQPFFHMNKGLSSDCRLQRSLQLETPLMKFLGVFLMIYCVLYPLSARAAEEPFRIGLSSSTMGAINRNDYMASFKSWATTVGKEQNLTMRAEADVVDVNENLAAVISQEKLDALTLTVADYMLLDIDPEYVFVTRRADGVHVRYALIVQRAGDIAKIEDLKGRKVTFNNSPGMALARPWLEMLLAEHAKGQVGRWLGNLTMMEDASKSILQVFFRQAHAALVQKSAFELACELNPQLKKDLHALAVSPPFIANFFIFRPTYQGQVRNKLEAAIEQLHTTPGGRQVLSIFQSSKMEKQPPSILDSTRQFLTAYQRLLAEGIKP